MGGTRRRKDGGWDKRFKGTPSSLGGRWYWHTPKKKQSAAHGGGSGGGGDAAGCLGVIVLVAVGALGYWAHKHAEAKRAFQDEVGRCQRSIADGDLKKAEEECAAASRTAEKGGVPPDDELRLVQLTMKLDSLRAAKADEARVQPKPSEDAALGSQDSPSMCGRPGAVLPKTITTDDWSTYACRSQDEAGPQWTKCVAGEVYSRRPEDWCPGIKRCCPSK